MKWFQEVSRLWFHITMPWVADPLEKVPIPRHFFPPTTATSSCHKYLKLVT